MKDAVATKRLIGPARLLPWRVAVRQDLSLDAIKAAAVLVRHEKSTDDLTELQGSVHAPAQETMDRAGTPVPIWASIAKAKITRQRQRLQAMTWAGIPISEAPKCAKEENLRALGGPFREEVMKNRGRQAPPRAPRSNRGPARKPARPADR